MNYSDTSQTPIQKSLNLKKPVGHRSYKQHPGIGSLKSLVLFQTVCSLSMLSHAQGKYTPPERCMLAPAMALAAAEAGVTRRCHSGLLDNYFMLTIFHYDVQIENNVVSTVTSGQVNLVPGTRPSDKPWAPNQCFELQFSSPYDDFGAYQPFADGTTTCSTTEPGFKVECAVDQNGKDTLQFYFSEVPEIRRGQQVSPKIAFTNFYTPWSSRTIETIDLRIYETKDCTGISNAPDNQASAILIQSAVIPESSVDVTSTKNVLGDTSTENSLVVEFTPKTQMSEVLAGFIGIGVPEWYRVDSTFQYMYPSNVKGMCTSDCFRTISSQMTDDTLMIQYDQMKSSCLKNFKLTITCQQFRNPISQNLWDGFTVTTFDTDKVTIDSSESVKLDARGYSPAPIPVSATSMQLSSYIVGEQTSVTIVWESLPIPIEQGCFVEITIPPRLKVDFNYEITGSGLFEPQSDQVDGILSNQDYKAMPGGAQTIIFNACQTSNGLGGKPSGRVRFAVGQVPNYIKSTESFQMKIYKNLAGSQLIAVLDDGFVLDEDFLYPSFINLESYKPDAPAVMETSAHQITFSLQAAISKDGRIDVRLPQKAVMPVAIGEDVEVSLSYGLGQTDFKAKVIEDHIIRIENPFQLGLPTLGENITLVVEDLTNPNYVIPAGEYQITTYTKVDNVYYMVSDEIGKESYTPLAGRCQATSAVASSSYVTYTSGTTYTLKFKCEHDVPQNGYLYVEFPEGISMQRSTAAAQGSCKDTSQGFSFSCLQVTSQSLFLLTKQQIKGNEQITLQIAGITNARSTKPSDLFKVSTYETTRRYEIDSAQDMQIVMQTPSQLESFSAGPDSVANKTNGASTTYTVSFRTRVPIKSNDRLSFQLPSEVTPPPTSESMNCKAVESFGNITCTIQDNFVTAVLKNVTVEVGTFVWTMDNVKNPPSMAPSSPFSIIQIADKDNYAISTYLADNTADMPIVQNERVANLLIYNLFQESYEKDVTTTYTISFTPTNRIQKGGSMQIVWPPQITIDPNAACFVQTNTRYSDNCEFREGDYSITITGVFDSSAEYSGDVQVILKSVTNPSSNRPGNGFMITTYSDGDQTYEIDTLRDQILIPGLQCEFPCNTCREDDRKWCTSCWQEHPNDPSFLMQKDDSSTCETQCEPGWTTNGSIQKNCEPCDVSCSTCADTPEVGDKNRCRTCAPDYPFKVTESTMCMDQCRFGYYQSSAQACSACKEPCADCDGSARNCTACFQDGSKPALFNNECWAECDAGYTLISGKCEACEGECLTCSGSTDYCSSCQLKFAWGGLCFDECPDGTTPDNDERVCKGCLENCDLCDDDNQSICLTCKAPLLVYQGDCVAECPKGYRVNFAETACTDQPIVDLEIVYFPFLIAAAIGIIVSLFGTKKSTVHRPIVSIIVFIAPLQFLATIFQWILCFVYGTWTHAVLACIVTLICFATNITFQSMYQKRFRNKQKDPDFWLYCTEYPKTNRVISALSMMLSFKFNKMYYSAFYGHSNFSARWKQRKPYEKQMICFGIIHMISVDLLLICADISGLVDLEWGTQLYITMIETLILSIFNIVAGAWELKNLVVILDEVEEGMAKMPKPYYNAESIDDLSKEQKENLLKGLMSKVKNNKALFLNNKLDDLIASFGDRRCKSMDDQLLRMFDDDLRDPDAWDAYDDRVTQTAPMAYDIKKRYSRKRFNPDDIYGEKPVCVDASTGMPQDLHDAMQRNQGDIMHPWEEEERRKNPKSKRRGRKNIYQSLIDHEDDEEADAIDASEDEADLGVIREEDNEEEILKKKVAEEQAQKNALLLQRQKEEKEAEEKRQREEEEENRRRKEADEKAERERKKKEEEERLKREAEQAELARIAKQEELERKKKADQLEMEKKKKQQEEEEKKRKQKEMEEAERKLKEEQERLKKEEAERQKAEQLRLQKEKEEREAAEKAAREAKEKADREAKEKAELEAKKKEPEMEMQEEFQFEVEEAGDGDQSMIPVTEKMTKEASEKVVQAAAASAHKDDDDEERKLQSERDKALQLKMQKEKEELERQLEADRLKSIEEADLARKQKEEADRKAREQQEAEEKARKEKELKEKEEEILRERLAKEKADAEQLRKQKEEELRKSQEASKQIEKLSQEQMAKEQADEKQLAKLEDELANRPVSAVKIDQVRMAKEGDFQDILNANEGIQIPPNAEARNFNENDIIGDLERDEKGNVIVLETEDGQFHDAKQRPTNQRGYLIDPATNDVVENRNLKKMFDAVDIDERGEIPAPFCVEKYNFNPHDIQGNFDWDPKTSEPKFYKNDKGDLVDKKGRRVNKRTWMVYNGGVVDKWGRKKFDRRQLTKEGELPKLLNYAGKRYDIRDVMGQFDKDANNNILLHQAPNDMQQDKNGKPLKTNSMMNQSSSKSISGATATKNDGLLVDNLGRRVNEKGYLIDDEGNIIDVHGKQLWDRKHLKNGEFPKIFAFTKFNIKNVLGDFEMNPVGDPMITEISPGHWVDDKNRRVNKRGYLIDENGNVIDKRGYKMFDFAILDKDGELPPVFQQGILKSDTASSLSRLMSEIEKNHQSEYEPEENEYENMQKQPTDNEFEPNNQRRRNDGETSIDSMMGDTPANYNEQNNRLVNDPNANRPQNSRQNQRINQHLSHDPANETIQEGDELLDQRRIKKKQTKKKKKKPAQKTEYLDPNDREIDLANAYGGVAKGQVKRKGVKYPKEQRDPIKQLMNNANVMPASTNRQGNPSSNLGVMANTVSGFTVKPPGTANNPAYRQLTSSGGKLHAQSNTVLKDMASKDRINDSTSVPFTKEVTASHMSANKTVGKKNNMNFNPEGQPNSISGAEGNQTDGNSQMAQSIHGVRNNKVADARSKQQSRKGGKKNDKNTIKGGDFDKILGRDIDEFLEDSEWDIQSFEQMSNMSGGSKKSGYNEARLKAMEQVYLQRIESSMKKDGEQENAEAPKGGKKASQKASKQPTGPKRFAGSLVQHPADEAKKIKPKVKPFRTTVDRFTDNPAEIHKGMNFALDTGIDQNTHERLSTSQKKNRALPEQQLFKQGPESLSPHRPVTKQ